LELGAVLSLVLGTINGLVSFVLPGDGFDTLTGATAWAESLPTLLSRQLIPNRGHFTGEVWSGTFLGLEPKYAWLLRVLLVLVYGAIWLAWIWRGYVTYRRYYRAADWTPTDDIMDRLRNHQWGQFGFAIVALFLVLALFAPSVSPTTMEQNIQNPYSHEIEYFDENAEEVKSITIGAANRQSISKGSAERNVGPWQYDDFDRFHPFGTLPSGKDLFTFLAYGARISLFIGVASMLLAGGIAMVLSMVSSFYKGGIDLLLVLTSDSVQALPVLMILILAAVVFSNTWIASVYNGALLFIGLFALIYWPYLWRAVRGPAFQVAEEEWIDAAKNYGQHPAQIMRKHMAPYIVGYMLIYASLTLGGVIISVAGLSFLGLGITPPTPEWGRAISVGQPYVASNSWHISLIPGFLITLVVTAFNALGDGIRDAIDPQSAQEDESATVAAGGGGA
jgi:peptide/nickel transport system permease protein